MSRLTTCFASLFVALAISTGGTAFSQGSNDQLNQLKASLDSNPDDIGTRLQLVNLFFMNGRYRESIDVCWKAIEEMPTRSSLYYFTGESYRRLGNFDSALIQLEAGYKMRPYPDLSESYGMVLLRLRRIEEATPILRGVAAVKTNFIDSHLSSGSTAYKNGDLETATDEFLAVQVVDKSKLNQEQLSFVQFNQNFQSFVLTSNTDTVVGLFKKTMTARFGESYDFNSLGESFRCLIGQKSIDAAKDLFEALNRLQPTDLTQELLDKKFFKISYELMLNCPSLKELVRADFRRLSQARLGLTQAELSPLFALQDFLLAQGATQLAENLTNKIMEDPSAIREPYLRMAGLFVRWNRTQEALQSVRKFFVSEKIDELGYTNDFVKSFEAVLNRSKTDQANEILTRLDSLNTKELTTTYITLAELFTEMGKAEEAVVILNKVLALDPGNRLANVELGSAYYNAGRYDEIIRSLSNTTDREGLKYLALAYEKKVMLPEANKSWQTYLLMAKDTAQSNEANQHIQQNTIVMMSPQYAQLRAQAAAANVPLQLAVIKPAGAVEDNSRGIALLTSDNTTVTFEGFAGSDSPIDTIMVNGSLVRGVTPSAAEIDSAHITKQYVVKFSVDVSLPSAQQSEVQVLTSDSLGNRAVKNYVVNVQAQRAATNSLPTIRVFIVGISQYADKSISLKYAEDDANLFYQKLRDPTLIGVPASNIVLLTNEKATREGILDGLESVFNNSFENDVVMIYLAMHGVTDEGDLYFIPYDAKITRLQTSAISGLQIDEMIKTKGAGRKVIMFVDACHAGAAGSSLVFGGTRAVEALPILLAEMVKSQPGVAVFSASDAGQVSREGEEWSGHGVFTYYLIQAMTTPAANANADQFIQLREIVDYVRNKVAADTKGKQTPVFKTYGLDVNMPLFYAK